MKKITIATIAALTLGAAQAAYTIKVPLENEVKYYQWSETEPTLGEWTNNGNIYDCSNWSPSSSSITIGESFTQTATDCKQEQIRSVQEREVDKVSGSIRDAGESYTESRTIVVNNTRESIGFLETWTDTTPTYTAWVNSGSISACTNWSPATSTVTVGQSFTQTATNCKQDQTRSRQEREQETTTKAIRNKGTAVTETQTITVSSTRTATGTKETWVATTPTYTTWVNSGAVKSCTNWSPATSTVKTGQSFTQTATDCKQDQTRSRQEREQETTTKAIRNKGTAVTETQTITVSSTRTATGTKETWVATTPTYTTWVNSGAVKSCTNWSPATSTVKTGQSFTQTATDCKQDQTRSRQEREQETTTKAIRNKGTAVTETQTITVSSTRTATGTKETWVATTPTYTTWVNSGAVKSCTNWSPATSTVKTGQSFTQTATDCKQDQTRSRQEREQETTTKAIRNKGTAVTETQTITVSSTRTATGTKPVKETFSYSNGHSYCAFVPGQYRPSTSVSVEIKGVTKISKSFSWGTNSSSFKYGTYKYSACGPVRYNWYDVMDTEDSETCWDVCREPI
nr:hypothetical protein [Pseudomonas sp. s4]